MEACMHTLRPPCVSEVASAGAGITSDINVWHDRGAFMILNVAKAGGIKHTWTWCVCVMYMSIELVLNGSTGPRGGNRYGVPESATIHC